jgi:adenylylsulfate kinase
MDTIYWFTGQPGHGKTVLSNLLIKYLEEKYNKKVFHVDGDDLRSLTNNQNYSKEGRYENIKRAQSIAQYIQNKGNDVVVSLVAPYRELREELKSRTKVIEIYVHTTDIRGREKFHSDEYESPIENYIDIDTTNETPDSTIQRLLEKLDLPWSKSNHGGSPTNNKDKKRAIFIGRYQPYHNGHIKLIDQKLKSGVGALIMIRDIEPDDKNPFTTQQTVDMIRKYHSSKGDDVEVIIIPDIDSVNYGRGVGYEINEFTPPDNIGNISATKVRDCIKEGDDSWKLMVDESIQEDIKKYLLNEK